MFGSGKEVRPRLAQKALDTIYNATLNHRRVIHHGGCVGCIVSLTDEAKMLSGMRYCVGCQYCHGNFNLPDLSLRGRT